MKHSGIILHFRDRNYFTENAGGTRSRRSIYFSLFTPFHLLTRKKLSVIYCFRLFLNIIFSGLQLIGFLCYINSVIVNTVGLLVIYTYLLHLLHNPFWVVRRNNLNILYNRNCRICILFIYFHLYTLKTRRTTLKHILNFYKIHSCIQNFWLFSYVNLYNSPDIIII